jgi:hypothetical protein
MPRKVNYARINDQEYQPFVVGRLSTLVQYDQSQQSQPGRTVP